MPRIGFVLLTHQKPMQVRRLVDRLTALFDGPPIVCHHDFSRCPLPLDGLPGNVSFVLPPLPTTWAGFSVVEATVRALRQLYDGPAGPDWCVLLSGSDYPVKPAARVLGDLDAGGYDAHIHHEPIEWPAFSRDWQRECYERYCTKTLRVRTLTARLRPTAREIRVRHPLLARPFLPFTRRFRCFAGSQWFCVNPRAAACIIDGHAAHPELAAHYRDLRFPEESYFQCLLANVPHLRLNQENWRYIDWSADEAHPKTLGIADLPALLASPAHFARKFDMDADSVVLDALDAEVLG